MRTPPPPLLPLFRSRSQVELLGLLVLQPSREWTLDDLARRAGMPVSSAHRELRRAVAAGVVIRDSSRRPHLYRASEESPSFPPLRELLEATVGVPAKLHHALADVPGVRAAAIHGSWASRRVRPTSDVDVIVVTDGDRSDALRALRGVGREIGREIDASILTAKEFEQMCSANNPFVAKVLRDPRITLVGDLHKLESSQ